MMSHDLAHFFLLKRLSWFKVFLVAFVFIFLLVGLLLGVSASWKSLAICNLLVGLSWWKSLAISWWVALGNHWQFLGGMTLALANAAASWEESHPPIPKEQIVFCGGIPEEMPEEVFMD